MARYTDSVCVQCRREGEKLFLKGQRCVSEKCAIDKRPYFPGEHGRKRKRQSEYNLQLREKQKAKRIYGILEKQFKNTYKFASKQKGVTGENLMKRLETRIDNIIYRAGFASSRNEARQLVSHSHIMVSNKKVNIPSYIVKEGEVVQVRGKSTKIPVLTNVASGAFFAESPVWLETNHKDLKTTLVRIPSMDEIQSTIQEKLIVELYSK